MTEFPTVKAFIVALFALIVISLGSALWSLFRGDGRDGTATVKALTVRVALSIALIGLLLVLDALGIISPHG